MDKEEFRVLLRKLEDAKGNERRLHRKIKNTGYEAQSQVTRDYREALHATNEARHQFEAAFLELTGINLEDACRAAN